MQEMDAVWESTLTAFQESAKTPVKLARVLKVGFTLGRQYSDRLDGCKGSREAILVDEERRARIGRKVVGGDVG
jgi:hypothetical protein